MEHQILEVVRKYQELVNTQDKELFDEVFSSEHECSLISITKLFKGKENIYNEFFIQGLRKAYLSIKLIKDGIEIRQINDDFAIVIFRYHTDCIRREEKSPYGISGLETQLMVREKNQWKIAHIHYSK